MPFTIVVMNDRCPGIMSQSPRLQRPLLSSMEYVPLRGSKDSKAMQGSCVSKAFHVKSAMELLFSDFVLKSSNLRTACSCHIP